MEIDRKREHLQYYMRTSAKAHNTSRDVVFIWMMLVCLSGMAARLVANQFVDSLSTETFTSTRFLAPTPAVDVVQFNATELRSLDHLVVVAGHAVVIAESLDRAEWQDDVWYLLDYQRNQDLPHELVSHIKRGVEVAAQDPQALLVFSGGQTRSAAGPRDEGSSYYRVAEHYKWWGHGFVGGAPQDAGLLIQQRAVTEDYATDSFQNLLFSIARFNEVVGQYPERITVVGFEFKRRRFEELHRAAIDFPRSHFEYIGVQPARGSKFDFARAEIGELRNSVRQFEADPYGCHNPDLEAKREARNPFRRTNPYPLACPELSDLFNWCETSLFPGPFPWSHSSPR